MKKLIPLLFVFASLKMVSAHAGGHEEENQIIHGIDNEILILIVFLMLSGIVVLSAYAIGKRRMTKSE